MIKAVTNKSTNIIVNVSKMILVVYASKNYVGEGLKVVILPLLYGHIKGFKFMANKPFRMEKKLGTSVCADISHYALKNRYIQFL